MLNDDFAFLEDASVVLLSGEDKTDEDFEHVTFDGVDLALKAAEVEYASKKGETAQLAEMVEKDIQAMSALLGAIKSDGGTVARKKEEIVSLHKKLSVMKAEVARSSKRTVAAELEVMESMTAKKTLELNYAIKIKDIQSAVREVSTAESVDLAFVIDGTGSMGSYIASVKENVQGVVQMLKRTNANLSLRIAAVVYRDLCDDKRFEVFDFVDNVSSFVYFLQGIHANGGGDTPEDMAVGIRMANRLSWQQATRVAFVVADCPCHGREFHDFDDNYPGGTPEICIIEELTSLLNKKADNGTMTVQFGKLTSNTDSMLQQFAARGVFLEVVDFGDAVKLASTVTTGVRKSIFKTLAVTGGATKSAVGATGKHTRMLTRSSITRKKYCIDPRCLSVDEWKRQPAVAVVVYRNLPIQSMQDLQQPIKLGVMAMPQAATDKMKKCRMFMRRATSPFAEGECRIAYNAQLCPRIEQLDFSKSAVVVKSFKHLGRGVNDRKQYLKQMEVSNVAHFLAMQYNKSLQRPAHCRKIRVLQVCVIEEEDEVNEKDGSRRLCAEAPLPAEETFTKFCNNTGYWNEDCLHETLLRFSKFTHEATKGYLMVTDLQGVCKGDCIFLTDPVILCRNVLRFGATNLGGEFMKRCIESTHAILSERGWK